MASKKTQRVGLKENGLKKGDYVILTSGYEEAGGTLFQIVEDTPPVVPHTTERMVKKNRWDYAKQGYAMVDVPEYGAWDEKGRKIMAAAVNGFIRVKPVFSFYPSYKAKNPKGKGGTLIILYHELKYVKQIDIVELCAKYAELGGVINDIVKNRSHEEPVTNTVTS